MEAFHHLFIQQTPKITVFIIYLKQNIRIQIVSLKMTNLFTYGTLMFKQVMFNIVKSKDYKSQPALLHNYSRKGVKNKIYPGIVKSQGNTVKGILYYKINQEDLKTLHYFEGDQYIATQVMKAIAYVYANPVRLTEAEWNSNEFKEKHLYSFANEHMTGSI